MLWEQLFFLLLQKNHNRTGPLKFAEIIKAWLQTVQRGLSQSIISKILGRKDL